MSARINIERSFESVAAAAWDEQQESAQAWFCNKFQTLLDADHLDFVTSIPYSLLAWACENGWRGVHLVSPFGVSGCGDASQLDVRDVAELAEDAHAQGLALAVDISAETPVLMRPLSQRADIVLCHAGDHIFMSAHPLMGAMIGWRHRRFTRGAEVLSVNEQREIRANVHDTTNTSYDAHGVISELDEPVQVQEEHADYVQLACASMALRMQARSTHTLSLARYLSAHPYTASVSYPGLAAHPHHLRAQKLCVQGYGTSLLLVLKCTKEDLYRAREASSFTWRDAAFIAENMSVSHTPCVDGESPLSGRHDKVLCQWDGVGYIIVRAQNQEDLVVHEHAARIGQQHAGLGSYDEGRAQTTHKNRSYMMNRLPREWAVCQSSHHRGRQSSPTTQLTHLIHQSTQTHQVILVEPGFESMPDAVASWEKLLMNAVNQI